MATKEQAVIDYDVYREALARFERYIGKTLDQAVAIKNMRLDITGDDNRKAALKAIVDQTPDTITSLVDRGKLAVTAATYLAGKYPELVAPPPEPEVIPDEG